MASPSSISGNKRTIEEAFGATRALSEPENKRSCLESSIDTLFREKVVEPLMKKSEGEALCLQERVLDIASEQEKVREILSIGSDFQEPFEENLEPIEKERLLLAIACLKISHSFSKGTKQAEIAYQIANVYGYCQSHSKRIKYLKKAAEQGCHKAVYDYTWHALSSSDEAERESAKRSLSLALQEAKKKLSLLGKELQSQNGQLGKDLETIGHCLKKLGALEEAEEWYDLALAQNHLFAIFSKANIMMKHGQINEASTALLIQGIQHPDLLAQQPEYFWGFKLGLGKTYRLQGYFDRAIAILQQACKDNLYPHQIPIRCYLELGKCFLGKGDVKNAEVCFTDCIEKDPHRNMGNACPNYAIGKAYLEYGFIKQAKTSFAKVKGFYKADEKLKQIESVQST